MIINYYYNIYPLDIIKKEDKIEFIIDNITYELIETNIDIKNLIDIYYKIIYSNLYCHEIILNRFGEYVTNYNNKQYIFGKLFTVS